MNFEVINPITYPNWDTLVLAHPRYSFFHTSSWARVLIDSYNYKPLYFITKDWKDLPCMIPCMEVNSFITGKRAVSLPFSDYCEPLINASNNVRDVFDSLIQLGKKDGWKYIEIRGGGDYSRELPVSSSCYAHFLDISRDQNEIYNCFRSNNKRNLKRALKGGVKIKVYNSHESVKDFYKLNCITRKKHGLPPQPYYFFEKIFEYIISPKKGIVVLANYGGKSIAAAIYFHLGQKVIYKYGASDERYDHLRANNLIMWESIKYYQNKGYKQLSFGRTELDHEGLRRFKLGWGAEEQIINYYKFDIQKETFVEMKPGTRKFKKGILGEMPVPVLRIVGSLLYRHIG